MHNRSVEQPPPTAPFWEAKPLTAMSHEEWESLCDGCGQCCLIKVEDEDTATSTSPGSAASCSIPNSCRCRDYPNRKKRVRDCISRSRPKESPNLFWLPRTCAYRSLAEGRGLEWWHPLVSGDPETVHAAGVSVRGWARSEKGVKSSAIARYIIGEAG